MKSLERHAPENWRQTVWHAGILGREKLCIALKKEGDRVVVGHQRYMANGYEVIKEAHRTTGNRHLVGFDQDEFGVWHDEDGDPVLCLSATDLLPSEAKALVAIDSPAGIWHINFDLR